MSEKIGIVMDVVKRRPACVLLQAALGGDSHRVSFMFDARSWEVVPTDNMRLIVGSLDEWRAVAEEVNAEVRP